MNEPIKAFSFYRLTDVNSGSYKNVCVPAGEQVPSSSNQTVKEVHIAKPPKSISFASRYKELIVDAGWWNIFLGAFQIGLALYCFFEVAVEKELAEKYLDNLLDPQVSSPEAFFELLETTNHITGKNPEITQAIKRSSILMQSAFSPEKDRESIASVLSEDFATPGEKYLPTGYYVGSRFVPMILGIELKKDAHGADHFIIKEYSLASQEIEFKKSIYKEYSLPKRMLASLLLSLSHLSHKGHDNQQRTDATKQKTAFLQQGADVAAAMNAARERMEEADPAAPRSAKRGDPNKATPIVETLIVASGGVVKDVSQLRKVKPSSDPISLILQCPLFATDEKPVFLLHMANHMLNAVLQNEVLLDSKKKEIYLNTLFQKLATLEKKLEKAFGKEAATSVCQTLKGKIGQKAARASKNLVRKKERLRKEAFDKSVSSKEIRLRWEKPKEEDTIKKTGAKEVKIHEVPGFTDLQAAFNLGALQKLCGAANSCLDRKEYLNAWKISQHTLHALPSIENVEALLQNHTDDQLNEISLHLEQISHYLLEAKLKLGQTRLHTNEVLDTINCSALLISIMRARVTQLGVHKYSVQFIHDLIMSLGVRAFDNLDIRGALHVLGIRQENIAEMRAQIQTIQQPFFDTLNEELTKLEKRKPHLEAITVELQNFEQIDRIDLIKIRNEIAQIKATVADTDTKRFDLALKRYERDDAAMAILRVEAAKPFDPVVVSAMQYQLEIMELDGSDVDSMLDQFEAYRIIHEHLPLLEEKPLQTIEIISKKLLIWGHENWDLNTCKYWIDQIQKGKFQGDINTYFERVRTHLQTLNLQQIPVQDIRNALQQLQVRESDIAEVRLELGKFNDGSVKIMKKQIQGLGVPDSLHLDRPTTNQAHLNAMRLKIPLLGIQLSTPYMTGMIAKAMRLTKEQGMLLSVENYTVPIDRFRQFLSRDPFLPLELFPENKGKIKHLVTFFEKEAASQRKTILLEPSDILQHMENLGKKAAHFIEQTLAKVQYNLAESARKSDHEKGEAARRERHQKTRGQDGPPFIPREFIEAEPFVEEPFVSRDEEEKKCLKDLFRILQGFEKGPKAGDDRELMLDPTYQAFEAERLPLMERSALIPSAMIDFRRQYIASQILLDPQHYLFPAMNVAEAANYAAFNFMDAAIKGNNDTETMVEIATEAFERDVRSRLNTLDRIEFSVSVVFADCPTLNLVDPKHKENATVAYSHHPMKVGMVSETGTRKIHAPAHGDLPVPISASALGRPSDKYTRREEDSAIPADKYREARDFPVLEAATDTEYALRSLMILGEEPYAAAPTVITQIHRFLLNNQDSKLLEKDVVQKRIAQVLFLPGVLSSAIPREIQTIGNDLNRLIKEALEEKRIFTAAFLLFLVKKLKEHGFHVQSETNYKNVMKSALTVYENHSQYASLCLFYLDAFEDQPEANPDFFIRAYDQVLFAGPSIALTFLQETLLPKIEANALHKLDKQIRDRDLVQKGNRSLVLPGNITNKRVYKNLFGSHKFKAQKTASDGGNKVRYTWSVNGFALEAFHNEQGNVTQFYLIIEGKKYLHTEVFPQTERHIGKTLAHHGMWQRMDKPSVAYLIADLVQNSKKEDFLVLSLDTTRKRLSSVKTFRGETLYFDEDLILVPHIGCIHESDILLLKDYFSVNQIQFLHTSVHLVKTSEGNWLRKTGEPGWKLWIENTSPLVEDLPCYNEFMLPFIHEEKGKEYVIFPHKITRELAFIKKPHHEEPLSALKISIDKNQKTTGTHASFLYMAYVYFTRGNTTKALYFLQACKEKGEFVASEGESFKKIASWFLEHPCNTGKALAFQLKLELVVREIQREQFHIPEYIEDKKHSYQRHLAHLLSLYREYSTIYTKLPFELCLTQEEVEKYSWLHLESFQHQLNNIAPPRSTNTPVQENTLFEPIKGPHELHPEFIPHLAVMGEPPEEEATLETLRSKKITLSEDLLIHFWTIWSVIKKKELEVKDLSFLFLKSPDDLTDPKLKALVYDAARLLLMQTRAQIDAPPYLEVPYLKVQFKSLLPTGYPEGAYKWSMLANAMIIAYQGITTAATAGLLAQITLPIIQVCTKGVVSHFNNIDDPFNAKSQEKETNKHRELVAKETETLERAQLLQSIFIKPADGIKPALPSVDFPEHFNPVDETRLTSLEQKAAEATEFFTKSQGDAETKLMTETENTRIIKGILEAKTEMQENISHMRFIDTFHLSPLKTDLQKTAEKLGVEKLKAEILKEAKKPENARALHIELFAASKEEYDEAILERVLDLYDEGALSNLELVSKVTTFLYVATAKQQIDKALGMIGEIGSDWRSEEYKSRSYQLSAQIVKVKATTRYTNNGVFQDSPIHRAILVHEYREGIILTKDQIRLIQTIKNKDRSLEELRMGLGKTTVIFPLVARLIARERQKIAVVLLTEELLLQCKDKIDRRAYIFQFDRNTPITVDSLADEYLTLLRLKQKGRPVITTIERLAALRNKIVETIRKLEPHQNLAPNSPKEQIGEATAIAHQLESMRKIYLLLRDPTKTILIADEIDEICSINSEKNYADGTQTPIGVNIFQAGEFLFTTLLKMENLHRLLDKDALATLSDGGLTNAAEKIAENLYANNEFWEWVGVARVADSQAFALYLSGQSQELPEGFPKDALKGTAAEKIDRMKHYLTKTFVTISKKAAGIDYDLNGDGLTVVPKKEERELPNTKYGQEAELVAFHFLHYIKKGPSREGFEKVIGSIEAEAARGTETWKTYLKALGAEEAIQYATLCKPENVQLRMQFLRFIIKEKPFILMFDKQLVCHVQDVVFGTNSRGASGTVNRFALLNLFGLPQIAPRKVTGETILKLNLDDEVQIFTNVLDQMSEIAGNQGYNTIVNQAFSIPGKNTTDVIAQLRKRSRREYIFVHPEKKTHYIWYPYAEEPAPFNKHKNVINKQNCLFYFGPADTRGVDFVIPLGKYAAVFLGPTTTLTQKEQAEWRLRALGSGQKPKFFIQEEHAGRIRPKTGGSPIQVKHLIADVRDQTIVEESMQNFKAASFTPVAITRGEASEAIFKPRGNIRGQALLLGIKADYTNFAAVEEVFIHSKRMVELNDYTPSKPIEILERLTQIYAMQLQKITNYLEQNPPARIKQAWENAVGRIADEMDALGVKHSKYLKTHMQYAATDSGEQVQIQEQQEIQQEEVEQIKMNTLSLIKGDKRPKRAYTPFGLKDFAEGILEEISERFRIRGLQFSHDFKLLNKEMPSTGSPMGYLLVGQNDQGEFTSALISDLDFEFHNKQGRLHGPNYYQVTTGGLSSYYYWQPASPQRHWNIGVYMLQNGTSEVHLEGGTDFSNNPTFLLYAAIAKFLQGFTVYSPLEKEALKNWFKSLGFAEKASTKNYIESRHAPDDLMKEVGTWMQ